MIFRLFWVLLRKNILSPHPIRIWHIYIMKFSVWRRVRSNTWKRICSNVTTYPRPPLKMQIRKIRNFWKPFLLSAFSVLMCISKKCWLKSWSMIWHPRRLITNIKGTKIRNSMLKDICKREWPLCRCLYLLHPSSVNHFCSSFSLASILANTISYPSFP